MRKKILLCFGTRPEAIKMAPVYRALRAEREVFETVCCVTAQHRALLDQMLTLFGIVPDIDLDLMRPAQKVADVHAAVLASMTRVLGEVRPDLVLVHGDTTTTAATALAAFYAGIPLGHVEAGLRSGDLAAPFPEELNRRVVSLVASHHFAPTEAAARNLVREGCAPQSILVTGNTVVDAARYILGRMARDPGRQAIAAGRLDAALPFAWHDGEFVLLTLHRRETVALGLDAILEAFAALCAAHPGVDFVWPLHPNPCVADPARARLGGIPNLHLVDPLPYDSFLLALRQCRFALTDSGGLQEEGPALGKPVLVMRALTERSEAIAAGGVRMVGTGAEAIVSATSELLAHPAMCETMACAPNPFGDGQAGKRIVAYLKEQF